jgi:hypothetical protein
MEPRKMILRKDSMGEKSHPNEFFRETMTDLHNKNALTNSEKLKLEIQRAKQLAEHMAVKKNQASKPWVSHTSNHIVDPLHMHKYRYVEETE